MKLHHITTAMLCLGLLTACGSQTSPESQPQIAIESVAASAVPAADVPVPTSVPQPTPAPTGTATAEEKTLTVGAPVEGAVTEQQNIALHPVKLEGASIVGFNIQVNGDGTVKLTHKDETVFAYDFHGSTQTINERRILTSTEGGDYLVRIEGKATYKLTVTEQSQQDGGIDGDAGDSLETARELELNAAEPYQGILGDHDRLDHYQFTLPAGSVATLDLQAAEGKGGIVPTLLHDGQKYMEGGLLDAGKKWQLRWLTNDSDGPLVYQLRLESDQQDYHFSLHVEPQQDGGISGDAGDTPEQARTIEIGTQTYEGQLGSNDRLDHYQFTLPAGSVATLDLQAAEGERGIIPTLLHDGQKYMEGGLLDAGKKLQLRWLTNDSNGPLVYQLRLESDQQDYHFSLHVEPQQDGGISGDAGDSEATARPATVGQTIVGQVGANDERDYYHLTLSEPTRLVINANIPDQHEGDVDVSLWRDGGKLGNGPAVVGRPLKLSGDEPLPAGEYYLVITGKGDYQVESSVE